MAPKPGSVAAIWPTIDYLIEALGALPELAGVTVGMQQPSQSDRPREMVSFGRLQDADIEAEHLSGGQARVARTERMDIEAEISVTGKKTMRDSAARAFEIASHIEDYLAAIPRLGGEIPGLTHLLVSRVEAEPMESPRETAYAVTLTLTGQARLRG